MIRLDNILILGLIPLLSLAAPSSLFLVSCNESSHFDCHDSSTPCIPLEWVCDNVDDCPNGLDESDCRYLDYCRKTDLLCRSVDKHYRCDGTIDCDDGSDEKGCDAMEEIMDKHRRGSTPTLSSSSLFGSSTSRPRVAPPVCSEKEFTCKPGQCIVLDAHCDGIEDCPLGDDEIGCVEGTMGELMIPDESHRDVYQDDISRDIAEGKDKKEETEETVDDCMHALMHGGQRCSQYCDNTRYGYECKCVDGYFMEPDLHTCYISGIKFDGVVYISVNREIRSSPLFAPLLSANSYKTVVNLNLKPKSIEVLVSERKVFVTMIKEITNEGVLAVFEDGTMKNLRENFTGIGCIEVDWIGGNIVITVDHPSRFPGIYVCSTSGLFCKRIINGKTNKRQYYRGLAVDPLRGLVTWVDVTETKQSIFVANKGMTNHPRRVMTSDIYHSNRQNHLAIRMVYVTSHNSTGMVGHSLVSWMDPDRVAVDSINTSALSFDVIKNDIYFSDIDKKVIEKINLDSGHRETVMYPVHHPYEISFFNSFLYWTEIGTKSVKVAAVGNLYTLPHIVHSYLEFPYGIAINHEFYQPALNNNPCEGVACPWICVVVQGDDDSKKEMEARCICPDEYQKNKEYDPSINGSLPCKPRNLEEEERALMSHVSVEAMEDYCKNGSVCMNGGSCVEHTNVHGRVDRITCKCASGYNGLLCEVTALPDSEVLNEDEMGEH